MEEAGMRGAGLRECGEFDTHGGKGVSAKIDGMEVILGNRALLDERMINISTEMDDRIRSLEGDGKTVILASVDGWFRGIIAIADTVKESAADAVGEFRRMGLKVAMITGDNALTAAAVARQVGVEKVIAEVLPGDKAARVRELQEDGEVVAFVGDGINDAPALARADVGIAIGSGTDVAIESGDVVLVRDDLLDAVAAVQLSRKVMSRIRQNLFWAFAYNTALIPVAAGILYPFFGITFRPEFAGFAMAMSSVTVVTLSLLLKRFVPPVGKSGRKSR